MSGRQSSRASSAAASECGNALIPGGEDSNIQPPNGQEERPIIDGPDAGCVLVEGTPPLTVRGLIPFTTYGVQIAAESLAGCSVPTLETFFCTKGEVPTTPSCTFQACRLSFSCPHSLSLSLVKHLLFVSLFTMTFAHRSTFELHNFSACSLRLFSVSSSYFLPFLRIGGHDPQLHHSHVDSARI